MPKGKKEEVETLPEEETEESEDAKVKWDGLAEEPKEEPTQTPSTTQEAPKAETDWEKAYKGLQKKYNKELTKLRVEQPSSANKTLKAILDEMEGNEYGVGSPRIAQLKAELAREEQAENIKRYIGEERVKLEQKIIDANLNPEDESLDAVWDAFEVACVNGNFDRIDTRLSRVLSKKRVESEPPTDAVEEKRRQELEQKNLLKVDTGEPSGMAKSFADIEKDYAQGKISVDDYREARRKRGLY